MPATKNVYVVLNTKHYISANNSNQNGYIYLFWIQFEQLLFFNNFPDSKCPFHTFDVKQRIVFFEFSGFKLHAVAASGDNRSKACALMTEGKPQLYPLGPKCLMADSDKSSRQFDKLSEMSCEVKRVRCVQAKLAS